MLEVRGARPEEVDPAVECCGLAFGGGQPERIASITDFFARIHKNDPLAVPENSRIVVLDGQIVSVVQIFDRQMVIGGTPIRMGGLGSVGTHPDQRGNGYNTLALKDSVAYMEQEGYDLSLLFTGINDYYHRIGWQTFEHAYSAAVRVPTHLPETSFSGVIRPMEWERDLDGVMAIHQAYNRHATGPTLRTRDFWNAHRTWFNFNPAQFLVAEENGQLVAYSRNFIEELGHLDGREDAALALAVHAFRQSGKKEVRIPVLPRFRRLLQAHGFQLKGRRERWFMFRIIRLIPLLEKLLPQMQERLDAASWTPIHGSVHLFTEAGDAALQIHSGRLSVSEIPSRATPAIHLNLTHADTIDLLLGQYSQRKLLANCERNGISAKRALYMLTTLFPRRDYEWYGKDGF